MRGVGQILAVGGDAIQMNMEWNILTFSSLYFEQNKGKRNERGYTRRNEDIITYITKKLKRRNISIIIKSVHYFYDGIGNRPLRDENGSDISGKARHFEYI